MEAARSLYERLWSVFGYGPWRVADTSTGLPLWSNVKAYFPGIYGVLGANGKLVALTNRQDVAEQQFMDMPGDQIERDRKRQCPKVPRHPQRHHECRVR